MTVSDQAFAELLERVEALEEGQVDQLVPGVWSINSAGELEEILSGKLTAKGIIFQVGEVEGATEGKPGARNELVWNIAETGVTRAAITAYQFSAKLPSINKGLLLSLSALGTNGKEAVLLIEANESSGSESVRVLAGSKSATILNSVGFSSFLRKAGAPTWRLGGAPGGPASTVISTEEGSYLFVQSASLFSTVANNPAALFTFIDGVNLFPVQNVKFFNIANNHENASDAIKEIFLSAGNHTLSFALEGATAAMDTNDIVTGFMVKTS